MNNTHSADAVVSVVTVLLSETHSPEVLKQAIDVLRGECNDLTGFLSGEVLLSDNAKKLAIVTEWRDIHAWSASRYDTRVGNMLEMCLVNSTVLDFELYHRKARFAGAGRDEAGRTISPSSQ